MRWSAPSRWLPAPARIATSSGRSTVRVGSRSFSIGGGRSSWSLAGTTARGSAADRAHPALGLPEERAVDEMPGLLAQHCRPQQFCDLLVRGSRAHRAAEVVLLEREQAGADLPVGREPDAVAVPAERLRPR